MPWGLETRRRFQDRTTSPLGGRGQGTTPLGAMGTIPLGVGPRPKAQRPLSGEINGYPFTTFTDSPDFLGIYAESLVG